MIRFTLDGKKIAWNDGRNILTKGSSNVKINKSEKHGVYSTMILHLAPEKISGFNMCPKSTPGCRAICLNYSGHGQMYTEGKMYTSPIHIARVGRTLLLKRNKAMFFKKLILELNVFLLKAEFKGTKPAIRLNGTSDLDWVKMKDPSTNKNLMELFPSIQFYDYTKVFNRLNNIPSNYFLNFSRSESNDKECLKALDKGINVTVVFENVLPNNFLGYRVIDGDQTDLRFLDNKIFDNVSGKGVIVGLKAKGCRAKRDKLGFVVRSKMWSKYVNNKAVA